MRRRAILATMPLALLAGCTMGPNYKRPEISTPQGFRGAQPDDNATSSLADQKWTALFKDPVLTELVSSALQHNFDLGIAAERVQQARSQLGVTEANQYPFLSNQTSLASQRQSTIGGNRFAPRNSDLSATYTQAGMALNWELDLWGRLRRFTESARAQYLASEEGRRGVTVSLVSDVIGGYLTLRERDLELEIAMQTRDIAQDSLRLVKLRHDRGAGTGLDVRQAEQFLYTATARIAAAQRDIEQAENGLSLLLGRAPGDIPRGKPLEEFDLPPQVLAGLPSTLLERRPDIRQAEQILVSANAQIGAAKALYFPQISLTGFMGGQSRSLTDLFTGPARLWTMAPASVLPVFNLNQTRSRVRFSEAQQREMVINYQRTIYTALREVSDSLTSYDRTSEQLEQQQLLVNALTESARLSRLRYRGGLDSYLQVLDSERNLFQGQLTLAQLRLQELRSLVQLYRALGGGWQ